MLFMCALACAHYARTMHALWACVYCTHVRVHAFLNWFSPNLVDYLICTRIHVLACAHYARAWNRRIWTLLDGFASILVKHSTGHRELHWLLDCTWALACAHYARAWNRGVCELHACVRLHIILRIRSKLGGNILLVTGSCMGYLVCTCTLACSHYEHMCAVRHTCVHS
jgi:hypothetical protein